MISTNSVNAQMPEMGAELRDIRGPVGIPGEWLWLWILLGVVAVVLLILWAGRLLKRKEKVKPLDPQKPAWEVALEAMSTIEREGYVEKGQVKEYYSQLSGVVRWYIEERFNLRAPEMTTEEFMGAVQFSDKLTAVQQGFLKDFLNASDMVKFAKFIPAAEEMFSVIRLARTFVEESR